MIGGIACVASLFAAYIVAIAAMSPQPFLARNAAGAVLIVSFKIYQQRICKFLKEMKNYFLA